MGGFLIFYKNNVTKKKTFTTSKISQQINTTQKWESQTYDQSEIKITVTPIDISPESKEWKFNVSIDSNSVELSQDATKVAILLDDSGKEYMSLRWESISTYSNHREGVLIFPPITPYPQHLKLIMNDINGIQKLFTWILEE